MPVTVTNTENVKSMNVSRQLLKKQKNTSYLQAYIFINNFLPPTKGKLSKSVPTKDKSIKRYTGRITATRNT